MPNPINANTVGLYLDVSTTSTPSWKLVVCITQEKFNLAGDVIDASSKCGQAKLVGQDNFSLDFTGYAETTLSASAVSYEDMIAIRLSRISHHWKMATPDGVMYYREFNGPLTNYTEDTSYNKAAEFTGTISLVGDLILQAP